MTFAWLTAISLTVTYAAVAVCDPWLAEQAATIVGVVAVALWVLMTRTYWRTDA